MRIGDQIAYRRKSRHSEAKVPPDDFVKGRTVWIAQVPGSERQEYLCTGKGDEALPMQEYLTLFPRVADLMGGVDRYRPLYM